MGVREVDLDPSQQAGVKVGDRVQITLPGSTAATGRVAGFGRVAQSPDDQGGQAADATIPTFISLDDPAPAPLLSSADAAARARRGSPASPR